MAIKYNNIEKIIEKLTTLNYTISFMESCSGGSLANSFTNVKGCSNVLKFSAITYSSEAKIMLGVNPKTIEKHTVYSIPVAKEMAKSIAKYSNSQFGVGVTGNLNLTCDDGAKGGEIYISIYNALTLHFTTKVINVKSKDRQKAKDAIVNLVSEDLTKILEI